MSHVLRLVKEILNNEKISAETKNPVEKLKNNKVNTIKLFCFSNIERVKTIPINITKWTAKIIIKDVLSTANTKFISGIDTQLNFSKSWSFNCFSSINIKTRQINTKLAIMVNIATLELFFPCVSSLSLAISVKSIPKKGILIINDKIAKGLLIYKHLLKSKQWLLCHPIKYPANNYIYCFLVFCAFPKRWF